MKIFTSILLLVCLCVTSCATDPAKSTFRIMSYNIHHGEGLDKKVDLERIAAVITDAKADIVALQEVDQGVERTARRDLPRELAELTGMQVYFERNIDYQGGIYGNAILTRFPIKEKKNTHYQMLREGEQRGVLQTLLEIHGREVLFMNTHIDYRGDDSERLMNADELRDIVQKAGKTPIILCGDFNDRPGSRTHNKIKEFLSDTWELVGVGDGLTFSADNPKIRIDYIWITEESIRPIGAEVISTDASDHLPLVAELEFVD